jgi:hypothetical protein
MAAAILAGALLNYPQFACAALVTAAMRVVRFSPTGSCGSVVILDGALFNCLMWYPD